MRDTQLPDYLPSAFMHFGLRQIAATISAVALILFCSCEKHRLGEDPEVQKEQVGEGKAGEESAAASKKSEAGESAAPKRTPGEFFPEATPSP